MFVDPEGISSVFTPSGLVVNNIFIMERLYHNITFQQISSIPTNRIVFSHPLYALAAANVVKDVAEW